MVRTSQGGCPPIVSTRPRNVSRTQLAKMSFDFFRSNDDGEREASSGLGSSRTTDADPYGQRIKVGYSRAGHMHKRPAAICAIELVVRAYENRRSKLTGNSGNPFMPGKLAH